MGREKAYWERHARRYDRSTALLRTPYARMLELTTDALRGAHEVLEIGAGTGLVTLAIARAARHVVATDYASDMVTLLERRIAEAGVSNVTCLAADLYQLPAADAARYDAAVAANVLHLVPDLDAAVASLARVVRPGGKLIAPTYCHAETISSRVLSQMLALTGFPGQRRFSAAKLEQELESCGARVVRSELIPGPIPLCFIEAIVNVA